MNWRSRIVGHGRLQVSEIISNPLNYRTHGDKQMAVVRASLAELGIVSSVIVNQGTGRLVDGHARLEEAMRLQESLGEPVFLDVEFVDLTDQEELQALLLLDASGAMAMHDRDALLVLVDGLSWESESLSELQREHEVSYAFNDEWHGRKDVDTDALEPWDNSKIKKLVKVAVPIERFEEVADAVDEWVRSLAVGYKVMR